MNTRTRLTPLTLALVAAFGLVACGKEEPRTAEAPKATTAAPPQAAGVTIMIGHVAPLTGGIAHLGKDNENGARLAIEEANATKIMIDGKEAKFVLIAEDDQADPKVGTTVAQKLVDAKVVGVVGHLNSGTSIPASPIYNQAGVPVISGSATNPKLTEQGFKQQFRVVGRDDQQGPAIASYLAATAKPKTVAVIDDATAYGAGIADEVEKTLKAAGVKVLAREKGTDKTTDWKAVLTKLKGRSPDAVFYGGMDATGGPLLRQGRELGIKAVFAFGDGACTDEMRKLAGDAAAEGLLCSQAGIPPQASSKKFLDAYKAKYNADPILYSPFTYDGTMLLIEAMKKANSADPAKYLPELQKISYRGATGPIAFDEKGDRKDAEITIFTMKGGKLDPIAIVKGGKTIAYKDFIEMAAAAVSAPGDAAKAAVDAAAKAASEAGKAAMDAAKK
jgi:branched-chain amino acid transport system substrate-binding protein